MLRSGGHLLTSCYRKSDPSPPLLSISSSSSSSSSWSTTPPSPLPADHLLLPPPSLTLAHSSSLPSPLLLPPSPSSSLPPRSSSSAPPPPPPPPRDSVCSFPTILEEEGGGGGAGSSLHSDLLSLWVKKKGGKGGEVKFCYRRLCLSRFRLEHGRGGVEIQFAAPAGGSGSSMLAHYLISNFSFLRNAKMSWMHVCSASHGKKGCGRFRISWQLCPFPWDARDHKEERPSLCLSLPFLCHPPPPHLGSSFHLMEMTVACCTYGLTTRRLKGIIAGEAVVISTCWSLTHQTYSYSC